MLATTASRPFKNKAGSLEKMKGEDWKRRSPVSSFDEAATICWRMSSFRSSMVSPSPAAPGAGRLLVAEGASLRSIDQGMGCVVVV